MGKIKTWIKENKATVLGIGLGAVGGGVLAVVSYRAGCGMTELTIANGLKKFHEAGIIKFFNPDTGLETLPDDACRIAETKFAK